MAPRVVDHLIDGAEVASLSGRTFDSFDPATGERLATVAFGEAADVDRAVGAARRAFLSGVWSRRAPAERARVMHRLASLIRESLTGIALIESMDTGKPIRTATTDVAFAADFMDTFAGLAAYPNGTTYPADEGHFVYSVREPYGVVGAIAPWNYPFLLSCWKTSPALAAGNTVVLKMAEETPLSTAEFGRLSVEAGFPPGVINIVHGDGPTTGAALVAHPDVPMLTFTGSTVVGQEILRVASERIKKVHLELGGKSPNIIFADADLRQAVAGSLFTAFYNSGQLCTSGSRLLVDRRVRDEVVDLLIERAAAIKVGDPRDPGTQLGPVVSRAQFDRVTGYVDLGQREGARLVVGATPTLTAGGYFVRPTIFADVEPQMRIAQEEIFGPVLSILTFQDEDEAIRIANDVMYGLAATVWTADLGRAFRVAERIDAGTIWTNCTHFRRPHVPTTGHKMSGLDDDLGIEAMRAFTRLKTHAINYGGTASAWA